MKHFFFFIVFVLLSFKSWAQINELGLFVGGTNYIGDIGPTTYIAPNEVAVGILYKWNKSPRHAYRFSLYHGNISSKDSDSNVPSRNLRDFRFKNSITEFSAGLEFNFLDFDLHDNKFKFTPYVFSGLSYFIYNENFISNKRAYLDYRHSQFALPIIMGMKARLFDNFIIGAEVGFRYAFTDNLDGSNPINDNFENWRFGNLNSKDWYVFSGFTLTYTFGKNPCFCIE